MTGYAQARKEQNGLGCSRQRQERESPIPRSQTAAARGFDFYELRFGKWSASAFIEGIWTFTSILSRARQRPCK